MVAQKVPSYGRLECYIIFRQYAVPIATRPSDLVQFNGGRYKGDYIRNLKPTNSYLKLESCDVSPDGERFLIVKPPTQERIERLQL